MPEVSAAAATAASDADWLKSLAAYRQPSLAKAVWQLVNTFVPYLALWVVMVRLEQLDYSYWITLALTAVGAALLARVFIFFHDCCHGSFFASTRANRILGFVTGVLTFTPYGDWQQSHIRHHSTAGGLDNRGVGDVWTLTVEEYLSASKRKRLAYRLYRNPFVLFGLGPAFLFLIWGRFPSKRARRRERRYVHATNLAILAIAVTAWLTFGLKTYLLIQAPIMLFAGAAGVWLFYVQHQFDGVYWARQDDWDPMKAALDGSSYYKLPKVLQWFTGNIGLHHIHHLQPGIPNYNLQRCYNNVKEVQIEKPLTLFKSLRTMWFNLWDEQEQKLISFWALRSHPLRASLRVG